MGSRRVLFYEKPSGEAPHANMEESRPSGKAFVQPRVPISYMWTSAFYFLEASKAKCPNRQLAVLMAIRLILGVYPKPAKVGVKGLAFEPKSLQRHEYAHIFDGIYSHNYVQWV